MAHPSWKSSFSIIHRNNPTLNTQRTSSGWWSHKTWVPWRALCQSIWKHGVYTVPVDGRCITQPTGGWTAQLKHAAENEHLPKQEGWKEDIFETTDLNKLESNLLTTYNWRSNIEHVDKHESKCFLKQAMEKTNNKFISVCSGTLPFPSHSKSHFHWAILIRLHTTFQGRRNIFVLCWWSRLKMLNLSSMYGAVYSTTCTIKNHANVRKYTIHGSYGTMGYVLNLTNYESLNSKILASVGYHHIPPTRSHLLQGGWCHKRGHGRIGCDSFPHLPHKETLKDQILHPLSLTRNDISFVNCTHADHI